MLPLARKLPYSMVVAFHLVLLEFEREFMGGYLAAPLGVTKNDSDQPFSFFLFIAVAAFDSSATSTTQNGSVYFIQQDVTPKNVFNWRAVKKKDNCIIAILINLKRNSPPHLLAFVCVQKKIRSSSLKANLDLFISSNQTLFSYFIVAEW